MGEGSGEGMSDSCAKEGAAAKDDSEVADGNRKDKEATARGSKDAATQTSEADLNTRRYEAVPLYDRIGELVEEPTDW